MVAEIGPGERNGDLQRRQSGWDRLSPLNYNVSAAAAGPDVAHTLPR